MKHECRLGQRFGQGIAHSIFRVLNIQIFGRTEQRIRVHFAAAAARFNAVHGDFLRPTRLRPQSKQRNSTDAVIGAQAEVKQCHGVGHRRAPLHGASSMRLFFHRNRLDRSVQPEESHPRLRRRRGMIPLHGRNAIAVRSDAGCENTFFSHECL